MRALSSFLRVFGVAALISTLCLSALAAENRGDTNCVAGFVLCNNGVYNATQIPCISPIPPAACAWGFFNDTVNANGWSFLEVYTSPSVADSAQAYAAGLLEGLLTATRIMQNFHNTLNVTAVTSNAPLLGFVNKNLNWIQQQTATPPKGEESYWHQVSLLFNQVQGLADGYAQGKSPSDPVYKYFDFVIAQLGYDLGDISTAVSSGHTSHSMEAILTGRSVREQFREGGCSALVKLLPDYSDIFISHDTWTGFYTMLRTYKLYSFQFHLDGSAGSPLVPGVRVAFSSYPGQLFSGDDFYQIWPSQIVLQETTNGVSDPNLFRKYTTPTTVPYWIRNLVSNKLATSGQDWTALFAKYNSGTYNNQWMVLDYSLLSFPLNPSKPLPAGLLYILEQIPGTAQIADVTSTLQSTGYWASYNIPYFPNIFNLSGYPALVQQYGDWFSYDMCPRAQIFRRDAHTVENMQFMQRIMRYNKFQTDPLSRCNCTPPYSGENTIAARSDLNPANGTYPISAEARRCHGATDSKIASFDLMQRQSTLAVSGPTWDDQPVFDWRTANFNQYPHLGLPDSFGFDWVEWSWGTAM